MNKIIAVALESKFPGINIYAILDVINATANPIVAAELLLGIYEEPVIPLYSKAVKNSICEFKSFDKFKQQVSFSYDRTVTKTNYFMTEEECNNALEFNNNIADWNPSNKYPFSKSFEVVVKETSYTDLNNWLKNVVVE